MSVWLYSKHGYTRRFGLRDCLVYTVLRMDLNDPPGFLTDRGVYMVRILPRGRDGPADLVDIHVLRGTAP